MKKATFLAAFLFCCFSIGLIAQNAPITSIGFVTNATTTPGATVVPITVKDFESIGAFTITLRYRKQFGTYVSATPNAAFPGMTVSHSISGNYGILTINWPQTPGGVTLPDESHLLDLNFTYISGNCHVMWYYVSGGVCQYKKYNNGSYIILNDYPKQSFFINGGFSSRGAPEFFLPVIQNPTPGVLNVPITVSNFISVGANGLSIEYNGNVLEWDTCSKNPLLVGPFASGVQTGSNGNMILTISFTASTFSTLANGATAYTIKFNYSTTNGTGSILNFIDPGCESADQAAWPYFEKPDYTYYHNGLIYTQYAPRVWLPNITDATPSGSLSLPLNVHDFNNVRSFILAFEYDPAVMTYSGFTPDPEFGDDLDVTNLTSGTAQKIVLSWTGTANKTLPDGSLIADIDFNYISGNTALTWLTSDADSCRFNDANGKSFYDWPKTTYYENGVVASHTAPRTVCNQLSGVIGQQVTVPVVVYDFSNIGSFALTLDYNPAVLTYQGASLFAAIGGNFTASTMGAGRIMMDWTGTAATLADSSNLVNLTFLYNGGETTLAWSDVGDSCRYAESSSGPALYDSPLSQFYINGYVGPNPLMANFYATGSGTALDTTITLHDLSTGSPQTWRWTISPSTYYFVNGTGYSSQNPQVKFTEEGDYTVTLLATKGTGSSIRIKKNYISVGIPVSLTCPDDMNIGSCLSQSAVNAIYAAWLASASSNCSCSCTLNNNSSGPPSACGETKNVTFTLSSSCYSALNCTATFTVNNAPPVVFNCGDDVIIQACSNQAIIDAAWAAFLSSTTASGGCNGQLTNNAPVNPPTACDESVDVTWTYESDCEPDHTCTKTFTITAPAAIEFVCAEDVVIPACSEQSVINAAWADFKAATTASGGCNGQLINNAPVFPPDYCGGSIDVTWTYSSDCQPDYNCTRTFTVESSLINFTCGENILLPECPDQATIDAAWATFLASTTANGGCNGYLEIIAPEWPPNTCGGSADVTWTYSSSCEEEYTCTRSFTVPTPAPVEFTCGEDVLISACTDQSIVDAAWTAFLTSTTANGGCNGEFIINAPETTPSACGDNVDVSWVFTNSCDEEYSCTRNFTVETAPVVSFTCGENVTIPACSDQAIVDAAWIAFLTSTLGEGGCNGLLANDAPPEFPSACGANIDVTWTYTSDCDMLYSCTRNFTVETAPAVTFTCGEDVTLPACSGQETVDAAWTAFLASTTASGGCNGQFTNDAPTNPPSACSGGSVDVTWTYTSSCETTYNCTRTFNVTPAPAVSFTCGENITVPACSSQAIVDAAWSAFLASTLASGGCNGQFTNDAPANPPAACTGGSIDVSWTYTSSCDAPYSCTRTFSVTSAPIVNFSCGEDVTFPECASQATVDAAWISFLASTTASGGCNGQFTNDAPANPPSACVGGSVDVTWTYTSSCDAPYNCTRTFAVTPAPAVSFTCGEDVTIPECATQATIDAAWTSFLASTIADGGCNGQFTNDAPANPPSACTGGSIDVTWTYITSCDIPYNCTRTFAVMPAPAVNFTCGEDVTIPECTTQAAVDAAWTSFLASATASGGCNGQFTNDAPANPPSACTGGSIDVTWTYTSSCDVPYNCTRNFTVTPAPAVNFTCGENVTIPECSSQTVVDAAWADFLASTTAIGGCNGQLSNDAPENPPSACTGGSVNVTWTYTSSCEAPFNCSRTFAITPAPAVNFTCGEDVTIPTCADQVTVDAAWTTFMASTTASGGCNGQFFNDAPANPPSACEGGVINVTWTYTSSCDIPYTCTRTFTVTPAPAVNFSCGNDVILSACADQSAIDAAWTAFLASTTANGGCGGQLISDAPENPPATCVGGSVDVTWTYTTSCEMPYSCTKSFTVTPPEEVVLTCPSDFIIEIGQPQEVIDAAYDNWIASVLATGGCNTSLINDGTGAPPSTGGSVTVNFTYSSDYCIFETLNCSATFVVGPVYSISGTLKYNNAGESVMVNVPVRLQKFNTPSVDLVYYTLSDGSFSFENLPGGEFTITPLITEPVGEIINATDAAVVNLWGTGIYPIEYVNFLAGDIFDDYWINSTDALRVQRYFVLQEPFDKGAWTYWKGGEIISSNWNPFYKPYEFVINLTENIQDYELLVMCTGDFNGSYEPSGKKSEEVHLSADYGYRLAGPSEDLGLPIRLASQATVGAISLILDFPADLAEITGITMRENNGDLLWAVNGNELRIGWNSIYPLQFKDGEELLTLHIRTRDNFRQGDEIRFNLSSSPLNELADGNYLSIPEALLNIDIIAFSSSGEDEPGDRFELTFECRPNPFANYTWLAYSLPAEGFVTLQISELTGRVVTIPVNEMKGPGRYMVKLDALPLQPGIYTATLEFESNKGDLIKTIKLVRNW